VLAAGNGQGGQVTLTGNQLLFTGSSGTDPINTTGAGTGNGGIIQLTSNSSSLGLTLNGNLNASPGTSANGSTLGGTVTISTASGLVSNAFTITSNQGSAGTQASATGGTVTFPGLNGASLI